MWYMCLYKSDWSCSQRKLYTGRNYDAFKSCFKGLAYDGKGEDGEAIIFMHDDMIEELNNARILYVDGVFKVILLW